jgi:hypothetical protein
MNTLTLFIAIDHILLAAFKCFNEITRVNFENLIYIRR